MAISLPVVNLAEAKFECIYGRGCDGICCQNGRPPISAEDDRRIRKSLKKARPLLRPEARALLDREGFVSRRRKWSQLGPEPLPMLRVVGGWCIFFNEGCVLHKLGAAEGDEEHDAFAGGVRGKELGDGVVEEGEAGGADAQGVGGEV